jgi:dTDP-L-rhamnose 4-epimerase
MRILVTGGAGFIGSHLVDSLVSKGHDLSVVDNLDPQVHRSKPTYLNPGAAYSIRDITADGVLERAIRDVDAVVHLASLVGVGQSMYQVSRYAEVNVGGSARLLQALVDGGHQVKKLVVASSMSIYGEGAYLCRDHGLVSPPLRPELQLRSRDWEVRCPICHQTVAPRPTPEEKSVSPNSVYAVTKRDQEELCLAVGRAYGLPTVALRFFNVYGPRQSLDNPYTGVAAIFQSRIKNGQPPVVFEDGLQTRDFVSVHDVVDAIILSLEKSSADYQALNVGSGVPKSIVEVAKVLISLSESKLSPSIENKSRAGDIRHCVADVSRITRLLGFHPKVRYEDGMRELVDWGRTVSAEDGFAKAYSELKSKGLVDG